MLRNPAGLLRRDSLLPGIGLQLHDQLQQHSGLLLHLLVAMTTRKSLAHRSVVTRTPVFSFTRWYDLKRALRLHLTTILVSRES